MKTDHAHVEASVLACLGVGVLAGIDFFVDAADGHPAKIPGYLGAFLVLYLAGYLVFRRMWRSR